MSCRALDEMKSSTLFKSAGLVNFPHMRWTLHTGMKNPLHMDSICEGQNWLKQYKYNDLWLSILYDPQHDNCVSRNTGEIYTNLENVPATESNWRPEQEAPTQRGHLSGTTHWVSRSWIKVFCKSETKSQILGPDLRRIRIWRSKFNFLVKDRARIFNVEESKARYCRNF